ncbi:beta-defensin 110-like [Physeter macrocephalus]|uniref:Beta-defensin n=1 Tax=Physeter macrocephalus TaxID=9755 RepID=A0A2Y9SGF2_PHYMC|nr:beta-defensin 110-like [Physeter catodon]|eukprot:XP_023977513.1 beta-defensin 110-like [Physeter catodon]
MYTFCASEMFVSLSPFETTARSELEPKYRFERCQEVKGICKTFCDDVEYDYGYCVKWRIQCCI